MCLPLDSFRRLHASNGSSTDQIDHVDPTLPLWDAVQDLSICILQILPRKHVLDLADYMAPTRQHELDHTDRTDQEYIIYLP